MGNATTQAALSGRLVMIGCGSVGQGVLPLIRRHLDLPPERITILAADDAGLAAARACGVADFRVEPLTRENYRATLAPLLHAGDFLLNLSVDVSTVALIELCRETGALYLDSCIEPWAGGYVDPSVPPAERSNYRLREDVLALGRRPSAFRPTAIVTHGVNPGLVSHFAKRALLEVARRGGREVAVPAEREGWARLAQSVGLRIIHVAERDTQVSAAPKRQGEFINTWSVEAFVSEGSQPAELGWGTHEKALPDNGRQHAHGSGAAIYLEQPGVTARVRSWAPLAGPYIGFLVTHGESISLADYLTVREGDRAVYRPTVHYAYHPCDAAVLSVHEFNGRNQRLQERHLLLREEITAGHDELGVLLGGRDGGGDWAYWYGSRLDIHEARRLAPFNNATTLQTAAGVLGGIVWAIENSARGIVEPDDLDPERVLQVARPYLGEVTGAWTDWTPLRDRGRLFPEDLDLDDPWQFLNVKVSD